MKASSFVALSLLVILQSASWKASGKLKLPAGTQLCLQSKALTPVWWAAQDGQGESYPCAELMCPTSATESLGCCFQESPSQGYLYIPAPCCVYMPRLAVCAGKGGAVSSGHHQHGKWPHHT